MFIQGTEHSKLLFSHYLSRVRSLEASTFLFLAHSPHPRSLAEDTVEAELRSVKVPIHPMSVNGGRNEIMDALALWDAGGREARERWNINT